jgi:hypothetical protein
MSKAVFCLRFLRTNTGPLPAVLCRLYRPSRVSLVLCDSGINIIVEGSKFKESYVLENTKLWNKVGRMSRPLVLFRPSNSGLASFCACFRYPVLGRSCPYASRHKIYILLVLGPSLKLLIKILALFSLISY